MMTKITPIMFAALLAVATAGPARAVEPVPSAVTRSAPDLMAAWRQLAAAPILPYQWPAHTNDAERVRRLDDYLEMGFTGIYKLDGEPPHAGQLFRDRGLHGLMRQTRFAGSGDPVLGPDGTPAPFAHKHPYNKSVFSPRNARDYYGRETSFARDYGPDLLFSAGPTIVMSSWDETGLYSRRQMEYGYTAREAFAAFLKDVIFHDATPAEDTNGDGQTLNEAAQLRLEDWLAVPLPRFEDRYRQPGLWKLWIDFHGYYTHLFFRRGGMAIGEALGRDVELFTFSHATAKWPGGSSQRGLDLYWQSRLNRVLTVEDCQPDYPGSTISYAFTDQLSRRYGLPVLGWSWFSPDLQRANEPLHAARALARAMGHNTHGLLFWVYVEEAWRQKAAMRASIAHWHRVYLAHWPFLRNAMAPAPEVAVVFPRHSGNLYANYDYPKLDYGWTCQALSEAHVPFEVIADNQVEQQPEILADYRVLILPSATWESAAFRAAIESFLTRGGFVFADGEAAHMDTTSGQPTDFLTRVFGVRPLRKYKSVVAPTSDSIAEHDWAMAPAHRLPDVTWEGASDRARFRARGEWAVAAVMSNDLFRALQAALPAHSGTGLEQVLLDPRSVHTIEADIATPHLAGYRTYHDIITGESSREDALPLGRFRGEICAVETKQTVWTGFRPGFDHACLFPIYNMRCWGEPIWPFEINQATTAEQRRGPREWICRVVGKAGVKPLVEVRHAGISASHVEVLVRRDPDGNAMAWLINHEGIGGEHELSGALLSNAERVGELRSATFLDRGTNGTFVLNVPALDVAIVAAGTELFVKDRLAAQASVPKHIKDMPVYGR